jgi:hypothetical protein
MEVLMKRQLLVSITYLVLAGCGDGDGGDGSSGEDAGADRDTGSDGEPDGGGAASCDPGTGDVIPLKEAKLIIEHNATDEDTGFQGFIDSDGWACLDVTGPDGPVLGFEGQGMLRSLGLTELFFETVEPENADVPIEDVLAALPEGEYTIEGPAMEAGEELGPTRGTALLTHAIPAGPVLVAPAEGATVPVGELVVEWQPVSETIDGEPVTIIAYQLIVEKDVEPHPHMIGKFGLSMYVPPTTTTIAIGAGFLEPATAYAWEVLAIEESGNQTLSSGAFETE